MEEKVSSIDFTSLDLGTGSPTAVDMQVIPVVISANALLTNFARAFVQEAQRKSPLRADKVGLTVEDVDVYCQYLLFKRVQSVNDECKDWRKLKLLYIPSFVQFAMSQVGKVVIRQYGLTLVPSMEQADLTFEQALVTSEKIAAFEDCLQMVKDAMPRGPEGDVDLMSTALIANSVRSMRVVQHVATTYLTAFLNLKIQENQAYAALYRVKYDDLTFITTALCSQKIV